MCQFKNFGSVEKKCKDCDYIIPKTDNDKSALIQTINSTGEIPGCKINT